MIRPGQDMRGAQQGSIIMIMALSMSLILGLLLACMVIGRQHISRRELQSAADAAALAGAYHVQQLGSTITPKILLDATNPNTDLSISKLVWQSFRYNNIHASRKHNRHVFQVAFTGRFLTKQMFFPEKFLDIAVSAQAQINEMVFGHKWPVVILMLDASDSMNKPLLGGGGIAWDVVSQVFKAYAANTLPVRNGLVLYAQTMIEAKPYASSTNNLSAITTAINKVGANKEKKTNIQQALIRARQQLTPFDPNQEGLNVIMFSEGAPTLAAGCPPQDGVCCAQRAVSEATRIRNQTRAGLMTVEIRHQNYDPADTKFLLDIAGPPNSAGKDKDYAHMVSSPLMVAGFMNELIRVLCSWGPLVPGPGAPSDTYRPRPGVANLLPPKRRVYVYLWDQKSATEIPIPYWSNATTQPNDHGFQTLVQTGGVKPGTYITLTQRSCNWLGADPTRRIIVRWDDAQLVKPPK